MQFTRCEAVLRGFVKLLIVNFGCYLVWYMVGGFTSTMVFIVVVRFVGFGLFGFGLGLDYVWFLFGWCGCCGGFGGLWLFVLFVVTMICVALLRVNSVGHFVFVVVCFGSLLSGCLLWL